MILKDNQSLKKNTAYLARELTYILVPVVTAVSAISKSELASRLRDETAGTSDLYGPFPVNVTPTYMT
jgi:hypothetical protein